VAGAALSVVNTMGDDFSETAEAVEDTSAEGCDWCSLNEIVPNCTVFNTVAPGDIHQGGIGDCWLVSAMASIAEYPSCVEGMIKENGGDSYAVSLYSFEDEAFIAVEVDDKVPCQNNRPMFVQPTQDGEIWPCLIEKAFAKIGGGYKNLKGGLSCFAFGMMKGCTETYLYQRLKKDDEEFMCLKLDYKLNNSKADGASDMSVGDSLSTDDMFAELVECNKQLLLMAAGSNSGADTDASGEGVVQGHAYTILDVQDGPAGSDFKLIQMRNPWGHGEWTGAWSDGSQEWQDNPDVADALSANTEADGAFWMPWEGFLEQYAQIFLCKGAAADRHTPAGKPPPACATCSIM